MARRPVTIEDKTFDHAFAMLFAVMGLAPILSVMRTDGGGLAQVEALASVPLAFLACYSFIIRSKAKVPAYTDEIVIPALSYLSPLLVLNIILVIPARFSFPWLALMAFPGLMIAAASIVVLRRSFAVLPSVRDIVTRGPYRWVRHPLYLGEAIFVLGVMLLAFNLASLLLYLGFLALMLARIRIEERKLFAREEYRSYAHSVRYRMLPYLY
jgi:protein-S-isoprenylcysteine O-methyltransferase Ste14